METYGHGIILIMIVTMLWHPVLHGYDKQSYYMALTNTIAIGFHSIIIIIRERLIAEEQVPKAASQRTFTRCQATTCLLHAYSACVTLLYCCTLYVGHYTYCTLYAGCRTCHTLSVIHYTCHMLSVVHCTVAPLYGGPDMAFSFPWRHPRRRPLNL